MSEAAWFDWREAPEGELAVVGDPIAHSLSPRMHAAALALAGRSERYRALRVPAGELARALEALAEKGYRGLNVTVPLKEEAFALAETVDEWGRRVGAVNALRLREGKVVEALNTDAPGFLDTLGELGVRPPGVALVLGAGGSARAVAVALDRAGFTIRLWSRNPARGERLLAETEVSAERLEAPRAAGCTLIVNATSASLFGASPPVLWEEATPGCLAYDLAYGAALSPFLREARARGYRIVDGRPLLAAQGARSLQWWLGIEVSPRVMLSAIR